MKQQTDILQALDAFIRKYYKNLLLKGLLYAVAIVVTLFLAAVLLEHFGWLSPTARAVIFWGGLAAVAAVLAWLVARPLLKMWGLGKRIDRPQAARIIGRHFPEVSDKLLNLLQLMGNDDPDSDLLIAAIEQKTAELHPVPFLNAINLKANRKYLRYALPPLAVLVVLLLVAPSVITEPSKRLINYNTVYQRPAPFRFVLSQDSLQVVSGTDFELTVEAEGEALPNEVAIVIDGRRHRMTKLSPERFSFTFKQVRRSMDFHMEGGGVTSPQYRLEMLPNPSVVSFRMLLSYPAYTGRTPETVVNLGDAAVPEGTIVRWLFQTQDASQLDFFVDSAVTHLPTDLSGRAEVSRRVMHTVDYAFSVSNGSGCIRPALWLNLDSGARINVPSTPTLEMPSTRPK